MPPSQCCFFYLFVCFLRQGLLRLALNFDLPASTSQGWNYTTPSCFFVFSNDQRWQPSWVLVTHACNPSYSGAEIKRMVV
jgi:hypothetical protein